MDPGDEDVLLVVPARGGSKGIPRKNLVVFDGKPLIQHTLDVITAVGLQDRALISTDDEEIAALSSELGFGSDYRRPAELSTDSAAVIDAVLHAASWVSEVKRQKVENIILLQPTSPRRNAEQLIDFLHAAASDPERSLVSVSPMIEHPMECAAVGNDGSWRYLVDPPAHGSGRQNYPGKFVFINGSMYGASLAYLRRWNSFIGDARSVRFFNMDTYFGLDIDEPEDLLR